MGFLAQLAATARGEAPPGAARPSLPPRFGARRIEEAIGAEPPQPVVTPPAERVAPKPEPRAAVDLAPAERAPALPQSAARVPPASVTSVQATRKLRPTPGEAPKTVATAPASPPVGTREAAREPDLRPRDTVSDIIAVKPAPSPPSSLPPRRDVPPVITAPLDAAVLAARREPARATDPALTIVIDRIDIRAPVPAPTAPPPRRERPRPARSLEDYLGARGPS